MQPRLFHINPYRLLSYTATFYPRWEPSPDVRRLIKNSRIYELYPTLLTVCGLRMLTVRARLKRHVLLTNDISDSRPSYTLTRLAPIEYTACAKPTVTRSLYLTTYVNTPGAIKLAAFSGFYFCQVLSDLYNSFTATKRIKFATKPM